MVLKNMKYLNLLRKLAAKSDHEQHKMSCLIVKKNRIISSGYNQLKTSPKSPHRFKSTHAEFHALARLNLEETKGCTVYVYRMDKNGILSNSKPCESCFLLLQKKKIKRIIYTYENNWNEINLNIPIDK